MLERRDRGGGGGVVQERVECMVRKCHVESWMRVVRGTEPVAVVMVYPEDEAQLEPNIGH